MRSCSSYYARSAAARSAAVESLGAAETLPSAATLVNPPQASSVSFMVGFRSWKTSFWLGRARLGAVDV